MTHPAIAETERRLTVRLSRSVALQARGHVRAVRGMLVECTPMNVRIGDVVTIVASNSHASFVAEVIALREDHVLLMPNRGTDGLGLGVEVIARDNRNLVAVGNALAGRVLDAAGEALDSMPAADCPDTRPRIPPPINPLRRAAISQPLVTGIRAIDLFATLGRGQRIGIFAGSGVGKSTLLAMICQHADADIIVVALIGERGREVGDFVREQQRTLAMKRTVIVAASADQTAVMRRQAAYTATSIAEHFRSQGKHVLLIMDSLTRFAHAQREIALAAGEPMASRGYPPSVFGLIPALLERAGAVTGEGTITGIYTVLVESDDFNEPVADALRATLDGHVLLDRQLAESGHFPAINVLPSLSRLAATLHNPEQRQIIATLRKALATCHQFRDLIELGAYVPGTHPALDQALRVKPQIDALLRQQSDERAGPESTWRSARELANALLACSTGATS